MTPNHALQRTRRSRLGLSLRSQIILPFLSASPSFGLNHIARTVNDKTKAAYRHLLYVAMIAIRNDCQSRGRESGNPLEWRRQYRRSRIAGATADWLHNLAQISSLDFPGFDEQRFWNEHAHLCRRFPGERLEGYREIFDDYLAGRAFICL